MAAAELSPRRRARRRWLPAGLGAVWVRAYAVVWLGALAAAALVTLVGQPLILPARRLLGATLSAQHNPPPQFGHVLVLAAHNIPIFSWPLLLGAFGAHRSRFQTHVADGLLVACIFVNTAQVGVGLAAYGWALLPYLPQVPSGVGCCGARGERMACTAPPRAHRQGRIRRVRADRRGDGVRRGAGDRCGAAPMSHACGHVWSAEIGWRRIEGQRLNEMLQVEWCSPELFRFAGTFWLGQG